MRNKFKVIKKGAELIERGVSEASIMYVLGNDAKLFIESKRLAADNNEVTIGHANTIASMAMEGVGAREISDELDLPYSKVKDISRPIREVQRLYR